MLEVKVTSEILEQANLREQQYFSKFGHVGTFRTDKHRQRMTGYIAEVAIKTAFPDLQFSSREEVDFEYKGFFLDSKAQGCNTIPQPTFVGTLYSNQVLRFADYYIFSRVKNDFSIVWIMGFIAKDKFITQAKLIPAGTPNNNFVYEQSRYEIEYKYLEDITALCNLK